MAEEKLLSKWIRAEQKDIITTRRGNHGPRETSTIEENSQVLRSHHRRQSQLHCTPTLCLSDLAYFLAPFKCLSNTIENSNRFF